MDSYAVITKNACRFVDEVDPDSPDPLLADAHQVLLCLDPYQGSKPGREWTGLEAIRYLFTCDNFPAIYFDEKARAQHGRIAIHLKELLERMGEMSLVEQRGVEGCADDGSPPFKRPRCGRL